MSFCKNLCKSYLNIKRGYLCLKSCYFWRNHASTITTEYQRFVQADTFEVVYGGGEANVAVSRYNFGLDAAYVTKLPDNLSETQLLTGEKVWCGYQVYCQGGDRIGIYCEKGASVRPSKVVYDRAHSSIAEAKRRYRRRGAFEGLNGSTSPELPLPLEIM